jgi:hypothetical protein
MHAKCTCFQLLPILPPTKTKVPARGNFLLPIRACLPVCLSVCLVVCLPAVNDAPSFRLSAAPFLPANPGTFDYPGFARNISQGVNEDASPELQLPLQFLVHSCNNPGMFTADGLPTITAAGSLGFRLTQNTGNFERSCRCQVQLQELGGLTSNVQFVTIIRKYHSRRPC